MLTSVPYKKVCAFAVDEARVIKQWGTSNSSKFAPFREYYGRLHELRSLSPGVPIVALTATATKETKATIIDVLEMKRPHIIEESPEKPNVTYVVHYIDRKQSISDQFQWLSEEIIKHGTTTDRTIIYCQTIQQCSHIYLTLKSSLGSSLYADQEDKTKVVLEMLHSCSPQANKEAVLGSFQDPKGIIRVLVCTIAFGMGVDCKSVHRTIHFGPSKNIEAFVQESGRAGRDGEQSVSYLLYHGLLLTHVDKDIKKYINSKDCRRQCLLQEFGHSSSTVTGHNCCDNCAKTCNCGSDACHTIGYPSPARKQYTIRFERVVSDSQKQELQTELIKYHKSLVAELVSKHASGIVPSQTSLPMLIGFSELQISQVLEHCNHLFSLQDVHHFIEIWDVKHAVAILKFIAKVFNDFQTSDTDTLMECFREEEVDIEDELDFAIDNWNNVIDDDFIDLIFDNYFDASHNYSDLHEDSANPPATSDIPNAVLEVLQNFSFEEIQ